MKAIFLKELRQWWRLGALGLVLFSAVHFFRAHLYLAELEGSRVPTVGLPGGAFPLLAEPAKQWVNAAGLALFALTIGIAQSLADGERDRRAFLLHRPLSPRRIFLARSAAGLTLFALAVFIPYAGLAAWVAIPGNLPAPWVPQMLIPTGIDAVGAVAYYFAGTLLTLRNAPWFGIRLMPLGAAIVGTAMTYQAVSVVAALVMVGVGVTALTAMAVESFVSDGEFKSLSRAAQFVVIPIASLSGYWLWFPVLVLVSFIGGDRSSNAIEMNLLGGDGRFHRVRPEAGRFIAVGSSNEVVTPHWAGQLSFSVAPGGLAVNQGFRDPETYCFPIGTRDDRNRFDAGDSTLWYFDRRQNRVLGYDRSTFRQIGVVGPVGFFETRGVDVPASRTGRFDAGRTAWIGGTRSHLGVLPTSRAVFSFSPQNRALTEIFNVPGSEHVLTAERWGSMLAVRTDQALYVKRGDATSFIRVTLPEGAKDYQEFKVLEEPKSEQILIAFEPEFGSRKAGLPWVVSRVESNGALVPVQSMAAPAQSMARFRSDDWLVHVLLPQIQWLPGQLMGSMIQFLGASLFWLGVAGLLCVRQGVPSLRALWWVAVTGLLGGFAVVALWMLESPTGRAGCPACRGSRRIVDDKCPHCGASWCAPKDGTELFEPRLQSV